MPPSPPLPQRPSNLARDPIRAGDRGPRVRAWQQLLAAKGFAVTADGIFGPKTLTATRVAQHWAGVVAVSAIVSPVTWDAVARKQRTRRPLSTVRALLGYPKTIDARQGRSGFPVHPSKRWGRRTALELAEKLGHHTGGPASFQADARFHVESDYLDEGGAPAIAYTLGVDLDGTLFVFNDWQAVTWHCGNRNTIRLGIVIRGNTDSGSITRAQRTTLPKLLRELDAGSFRPFKNEPAWPRVKPSTTHRHVKATSCPGEPGESLYRSLMPDFHTYD